MPLCWCRLTYDAPRGTKVAEPNTWRGQELETALQSFGYELEDATQLERLSAYNGVISQTDETPTVASCGEARADGLALSRDLFFDAAGDKHLCGAKVRVLIIDPETEKVEAVETRTVWDTMDERFTKTGDLYFRSRKAAQEWGVKKAAIVPLEP